jgi:hypothetical protein
MWVVDYQVIYGNPADQREWDEKLDPYLLQPFEHASGQLLRIEAAASRHDGPLHAPGVQLLPHARAPARLRGAR